jgi:uncharacterized protein (TIGR02646 family)
MRQIVKNTAPETYLQWIAVTADGDYNGLTYERLQKPQKDDVRNSLVLEQLGICAYTGIELVQPFVTIEHIKPRTICKNELIDSGIEHGSILCCDLYYDNMVAVFKTNDPEKYFGEACRSDWFDDDYVSPLSPEISTIVNYDIDGNINPINRKGKRFIEELKLDHKELILLRKNAILDFIDFDSDEFFTEETLNIVFDHLENGSNQKLPAFSFAILDALKTFLESPE